MSEADADQAPADTPEHESDTPPGPPAEAGEGQEAGNDSTNVAAEGQAENGAGETPAGGSATDGTTAEQAENEQAMSAEQSKEQQDASSLPTEGDKGTTSQEKEKGSENESPERASKDCESSKESAKSDKPPSAVPSDGNVGGYKEEAPTANRGELNVAGAPEVAKDGENASKTSNEAKEKTAHVSRADVVKPNLAEVFFNKMRLENELWDVVEAELRARSDIVARYHRRLHEITERSLDVLYGVFAPPRSPVSSALSSPVPLARPTPRSSSRIRVLSDPTASFMDEQVVKVDAESDVRRANRKNSALHQLHEQERKRAMELKERMQRRQESSRRRAQSISCVSHRATRVGTPRANYARLELDRSRKRMEISAKIRDREEKLAEFESLKKTQRMVEQEVRRRINNEADRTAEICAQAYIAQSKALEADLQRSARPTSPSISASAISRSRSCPLRSKVHPLLLKAQKLEREQQAIFAQEDHSRSMHTVSHAVSAVLPLHRIAPPASMRPFSRLRQPLSARDYKKLCETQASGGNPFRRGTVNDSAAGLVLPCPHVQWR